MARYALKALLAFTLLASRSMAIAELPAYVERIGVYRDINAAVLRMTPEALAQMLAERARAGQCGSHRVGRVCALPEPAEPPGPFRYNAPRPFGRAVGIASLARLLTQNAPGARRSTRKNRSF